MDCREEVALLERRFKHLPGLEDFSADLMGQRLHVKYDAAKVSASAIAAAVADAGMRAWLEHEEPLSIGRRAGAAPAGPARSSRAARWRRGLLAGGRRLPRLGGDRRCSRLSVAAGVPLTIGRPGTPSGCARSTSTC